MGEGVVGAMGLLDKFFKARAAQQCGDLSIEKIKAEQTQLRKRLDNVRATLDGEDGWFLSMQQRPPNEVEGSHGVR